MERRVGPGFYGEMDFNRYRSRIVERHGFGAYDKVCIAVTTKQAMANLCSQMHVICAAFVKVLKELRFVDYNLMYTIGSQISFGILPTRWHKTLYPRNVEDEGFKEIHLFGDEVYQVSDRYSVSRNLLYSSKRRAVTIAR